MTLNSKERREISQYLLGRLDADGPGQHVEERLFVDPDYYEELLVAEDELIDAYLSGALSAEDREAFERHFLSTPARVRKFRFARSLGDYVEANAPRPAPEARARTGPLGFLRTLVSTPLRAALVVAVSLVLVFGALLAWRGREQRDPANLAEGLAALHEAYHGARPFEARISDFPYAQWSLTRDGNAPHPDAIALERAGYSLRAAQDKHRDAAADHALGSFYLAGHDYDQAITLFEGALRSDERNARLHNDLGVALLEKAKSAKDKGGDLGAASRSFEQFDRALELDDSLLEARFNRALAYQQMGTPRQAVDAWNDYLKHDSGSPWADEARTNLRQLQTNLRQLQQDKGAPAPRAGRAVEEFLEARKTDDEAAWKVVVRSYNSSGNEVVNGLADALVGLESDGARVDPSVAAPALSDLARLESERAGDRYTSDLFALYERAAPRERARIAAARARFRACYSVYSGAKFSEAAEECGAAARAYEGVGDAAGKALADYLLGVCYIFTSDDAKARQLFAGLSALCEQRQYRWLSASRLYRLAHISFDKSEYSKALDYSTQALSAFERVGDPDGTLRCLVQLADENQALNRVGRAFTYARRGFALASEVPPNQQQLWLLLSQMAFDLSSMRLHRAALAYRKEALAVALETNVPLYKSRSYGYAAASYAALGRYAEAAESARRGYEAGGDDLEMTANASLQLGDALRQSGDCGKAVESYDRSLELYARLNDAYYSYAAHKGKLLCYVVGPDGPQVGAELETALRLVDEYRPKIVGVSQRESFFDMEQGIYDVAIRYEYGRGNQTGAFDRSEESRARSLLDAAGQRGEVKGKVYGPELELPESVTATYSYAQVQASMPEAAQILQIAVLEDKVILWVVTRSEIRWAESPVGARALAEKVRAYVAAVSAPPRPDSPSPTPMAEELYRLLVAPVEPYLDKTKYLCVVPDKSLHYLPFHALISPATRKYLLDEYERGVGVAPSSTLFVALSKEASNRDDGRKERLLSLGDPAFDREAFPSLLDLPSAEKEAAAVAASYQSAKPRVLVGDAATEQALRAGVADADVLHLAAHYVVDDDSEMLSGFALAPSKPARGAAREDADGSLQAYEIYRMKSALARLRLVVLSGCRTGVERLYAGEGAVGVARPFLAANVPVVVASLWPVDSPASAELMSAFHANRARGKLPTPEALRLAQREMAQGPDTRYRHPYYWAAFVNVGALSRF